MCGTAWNAMKESEKAPYYEKYNIDKARYLKEVKNDILIEYSS